MEESEHDDRPEFLPRNFVDQGVAASRANDNESDNDAHSDDNRRAVPVERNGGQGGDDAASSSETVDSDDNRKPAAVERNNEGGDGNDQSSSNIDSEEDDKSGQQEDQDNGGALAAASVVVAAGGDGRQLSQYELQRQERIARNKQYLASLGLEGKEGGSVLGPRHPSKPKIQRKKKVQVLPTHKRSSARAKTSINYTEPTISVASLLRTNDAKNGDKTPKSPKPRPERKTKDLNQRLEKFLYLEFKSIKAHKKQLLIQAEKNVRNAGREIKYWDRRAAIRGRQEQRKQDQVKTLQQLQEDRKHLGGGTAKALLQEIDTRMPEILSAIEDHDDVFEAAARSRVREIKRLENDAKMKMLDSLDRFPKAMKEAISVLNSALLERTPTDPPPPRRSTRKDADETMDDVVPKKGGKHKDGESNSNLNATMRGLQTDHLVPDEADSSPTKDPAIKVRKRNLRNVGGWVSPNFATAIDREWLERDTTVDSFDISAYVPQVGDTVLYYPDGHRQFLGQYPDFLGKKTRSTTRVPLWERAATEKSTTDTDPKAAESETTPQRWWCDEWLSGMENSTGKYPLVCRVERTHAEFPPDPFTKVVTKDKGSEEVRVYWKGPKEGSDLKKGQKSRLRLAVMLRPLTPVLPPSWNSTDPSAVDLISLPPLFSVVTFPSDLDPFLVPFAWAYSLTHSLSVDEKVNVGSKTGPKMRVSSFASLDETFGSFRLDDKSATIKSLLAHFYNKKESTQDVLERAFSNLQRPFPLAEAFAVLETLAGFLGRTRGQDAEVDGVQVEPAHLVDLIRSTLPLWGSVSIMKDVYDRKSSQVSPWNLQPVKARSTLGSSSAAFADTSHALDEALRVKLEYVLEDAAKETPDADIFYSPVTEDDAPGYGCAVPCSLFLEKVLRRLKAQGRSQRCYYRGVAGLLSDISAILDNCILYNSPESDVVVAATGLVSSLKTELSKVAQQHFGEMKEAKDVDEKRRRFVMQSGQSGVDSVALGKAAVVDTLRNPFKDPLYRDWLQAFRTTEARGDEVESRTLWVPQPGDEILYSHWLHSSFAKSHYQSLESHQCVRPRLSTSTELSDDDEKECKDNREADGLAQDWLKGCVVWARPAFPRVTPTKGTEDAATFPTNAAVLAVGIRFHDEFQQPNLHIVYWRPCRFPSDPPPEEESESCAACGVSHRTSFLQPSLIKPAEDSYEDGKSPLGVGDDVAAIGRCLGLLKKRCLRGIPPGYVDQMLTKANVKDGYIPALVKVGGAKSAPSFEDAFAAPQEKQVKNTNAFGTRAIKVKPPAENPAPEKLMEAGYLPPWLKPGSGEVVANLLQSCGAIFPCPKLSLELVHLRLKNGYYRDRSAAENDIVEAYAGAVFMLLSEAASRKKSPLSTKKLARALVATKLKPKDSSEGTTADPAVHPPPNDALDEETLWLERLSRIRELYAVAFVSISETVHTERVFGLVGPPSIAPLHESAPSGPRQKPSQIAARQSLRYLLLAIGKDALTRPSRTKASDDFTYPSVNVKVVCDGRVVDYDRHIATVTRAVAEQDGSALYVKIVCDGKPVTVKKIISPSAAHADSARESKVSRIKANSIMFESDDYEADDALSQLFFGHPGRMHACARCQAYKRSMLSCRIRRGHANADFDWPSFFEGLGGVDGLLKDLSGDSLEGGVASEEAAPSSDAAIASNAKPSEPNQNGDAKQASNVEAAAGGAGGEDEEVKAPDPREMLAQAKTALSTAESLLPSVRAFAEAPARFSKAFVDTCFPVDSSDGHYIYCVVCGLSGDLLCCDGCSNVVHTDCIALKEIPDDDWFCEECVRKKAKAAKPLEGSEGASESEPPPFGRVTFDSGPIDDVTSALDAVRSLRPEKLKQNSLDDKDADADSQGSGSDEDADFVEAEEDNVPRGRGRPRRRASAASVETGEETTEPTNARRGRGRPRIPPTAAKESPVSKVSRKRGRPRQEPLDVESEPEPDVPRRRGRSTKPVEKQPRPPPRQRGSVDNASPAGRGRSVASRRKGTATAHAVESPSTRRGRRSQPPKRLIDNIYVVETQSGSTTKRRVKSQETSVLDSLPLSRKRSSVQRAPVHDENGSAVLSVTSETSMPPRRQRRVMQRLVDESTDTSIPTSISRPNRASRRSSNENAPVANNETDALNVLEQVQGLAQLEEEDSGTRKSKRRRKG